jgi:hypothetical protein
VPEATSRRSGMAGRAYDAGAQYAACVGAHARPSTVPRSWDAVQCADHPVRLYHSGSRSRYEDMWPAARAARNRPRIPGEALEANEASTASPVTRGSRSASDQQQCPQPAPPGHAPVVNLNEAL